MPSYSNHSKKIIKTCDERIQRVFNEVIKHIDCRAINGARGQVEQDELFLAGKSQVKYPNSQHNYDPSRAIDIVPYPIDWNDRERFTIFAGFVLGTAKQMGVNLIGS